MGRHIKQIDRGIRYTGLNGKTDKTVEWVGR